MERFGVWGMKVCTLIVIESTYVSGKSQILGLSHLRSLITYSNMGAFTSDTRYDKVD